MPMPAGLSTVHRRTVWAGAAAHLDADGGPGDDPHVHQLGRTLLDQQRGRRRVLALHVHVLHDGRGPHGERHPVHRRDPHRAGEPSGPRSVTARWTTRFSR